MYNLELFSILFLISIILMTLEYHKIRKITFIINITILYVLLEIISGNTFWHFIFLSDELWRNIIVTIIGASFVVILNLIKELTFEVVFLNFMVLLGSLMIVTSDHLIVIYLGLELQTFSLFILISKDRKSIKSSESALKYFILGALSSGLFLLGVTLIFSLGLSLNLKELSFSLGFTQNFNNIASFLICISLFFKLALFPLHFWVADIYEGSSWDVISLISTIPKISVLSIILQVIYSSDFFLVCATLSIIIGTLGAMNQTKMKRLLAYSGISHIGFIMMGVSILSNQGYEASFIYLFTYIITMLGVFLLIYQNTFSENYYLIELGGLGVINKILGLTWLVLFLSIAGIPPLSGFISKWLILVLLLDYKFIFLSIVVVVFSAISAGYYLRIVKISYFQKSSSFLSWKQILNPQKSKNSVLKYLLGLCLYFNLILIIHPSIIFSPFYLGFNYFF